MTMVDTDFFPLGNWPLYWGWLGRTEAIDAGGMTEWLPSLALQIRLVNQVHHIPLTTWMDEVAVIRPNVAGVTRLSGSCLRRQMFFLNSTFLSSIHTIIYSRASYPLLSTLIDQALSFQQNRTQGSHSKTNSDLLNEHLFPPKSNPNSIMNSSKVLVKLVKVTRVLLTYWYVREFRIAICACLSFLPPLSASACFLLGIWVEVMMIGKEWWAGGGKMQSM